MRLVGLPLALLRWQSRHERTAGGHQAGGVQHLAVFAVFGHAACRVDGRCDGFCQGNGGVAIAVRWHFFVTTGLAQLQGQIAIDHLLVIEEVDERLTACTCSRRQTTRPTSTSAPTSYS